MLGGSNPATDVENMCLPALQKSDQTTRLGGKRIYPRALDGQGTDCGLDNDAYAWQFHAAAGSHTSTQSKASLRVYSAEDHGKLYEGLAGRPHLTGPPRPYDTPRRRFPGANVSQVDGLLRDDRTPLASEHPSQYGQLYNGAAGVHGHWLLKPKGDDLQQSGGCGGAGPSQVDEIVLGHDIDGSTSSALKQLLSLEGAAGCKSIGVAPKLEGKRSVPGGGDSQVDELIWGTDVDGSSDPALVKAKDQLFQGAAGGKMPLTSRGRRHVQAEPSGRAPKSEGRRHHAGPADGVAVLLGKPESLESSSWHETPRPRNSRRHIPVGGASRVDDVVLGKDIDGAARMSVLA
ncbi:unnamed protein product [Symbiodinium sp. CCMP2456]|nr:unnamed protein product [Symbiodinium sp. CCMP2456]